MEKIKDKKFYIIGLGSMGKRRIRNLLFNKIKKEHICGFDINDNRRKEVEKEYRIRTFDNFKKGILEFCPDALIISTPPDKHKKYFMFAVREKMHFFTEVATTNDGYKELIPLLDEKFIAAPSCTFRYLSAIKKINSILKKNEIGNTLAFEHYLGQYLPDWHPYEDYSTVYFAKKQTGGCKEMLPYELNWILYIFKSEIKDIKGVHKKVSNLKISADDLYVAVVEMERGIIGTVVIDLLNRTPRRTFTIIGTKGSLEWNWIDRTITISTRKKRSIVHLAKVKKIKHYNTDESAYQDEIKDFILSVQKKKKYPYTFKDDDKILSALNRFLVS